MMTIISICLVVGGLLLMSRGGVPESVSGLVYNLSKRMRWAWSGWLIAVALTLMVPLMGRLGDVGWQNHASHLKGRDGEGIQTAPERTDQRV